MNIRDHALAWGDAIAWHLANFGATPDDYADWFAETYPQGDVSHAYAVSQFKKDVERGLVGVSNPVPLDVWLRFDGSDTEEAEAEANTYHTGDGRFRVEWYLTSVGLVKSSEPFATYQEACDWLTKEGFENFSS